jgi:hypothetical protein
VALKVLVVSSGVLKWSINQSPIQTPSIDTLNRDSCCQKWSDCQLHWILIVIPSADKDGTNSGRNDDTPAG